MKHFTILLTITLLLNGCAKTAPEAATEAALIQVGAVEQAIKKECPQAKIDKDMEALRATIVTQLKTCEGHARELQADKVKWQVAFFALLVVVGVYFSRRLV